MEPDGALGIVKFGKREYIDAFVRGSLYMNPLSYFLKLEKEDLARYDPHEGESFMVQAHKVRLSVKTASAFVPVEGLTGALHHRQPENLKTNVFCMYALLNSASFRTPAIDPRNLAFGDTFAFLLNADEFIRRVDAAAARECHQITRELVRYVDEAQYSGALGVFRNRLGFAYQSEFRIALQPGFGRPYVLEVGDLSDITYVGPLSELNDRLRFEH